MPDWLAKILIIAPAALIMWLFLTVPDTVHCPKCDQKKALKKTGATKGGGSVKRRVEWKCRYCGYRTWKDKYREMRIG